MADWQDSLPLWAGAWAAVRGQSSAAEGSGIVIAPAGEHAHPEYVLAWPGSDAERAATIALEHPGTLVTLVTGDPGDALADYAAARGLVLVDDAVLLSAATDQLNAAPELPENAELAQAPLELYDFVEISVFDHPVASGRIRIEDGLAVIGGLQSHGPGSADNFEPAVLAALADEAYVHGVETLYTILPPDRAADFVASGWTQAARIVSLSAPA